jgi:hypothetical protein
MLRSIALLLCVCTGEVIALQPTATSASINVYLDCEAFGCDFDYFRTELTMVNWVRDRQVADIHLLVTTQQTGSGGREFTVTFLGLRQFAGVNDTLKYVAPPAASEDEMRKGLGGVFRLGFVRYFARIPAGARLTVSFGDTAGRPAQEAPKKDRWKAWVFRTSVRGFTFGEEQYKQFNGNGSLNADRVTEQWKTRLSVGKDYSETRNTYPVCDGTPSVCIDTTDVNIRRGDEASILQVKSLGKHWSAGLRLGTHSTTYQNYRRVVRVFPALEYDLFPYSESTRQQVTLEYNIGYGYYQYNDTTVLDKISESMPIQRLLVGVKTRKPWGSIDVGSNLTSYLNDAARYRIGSYGGVSLNLFRGLQLEIFGEYERIRDQFNLRKKDLTPEEILTRQFQLGTGYTFFGQVFLSYSFGSIYNNVVNPRMQSGGF